MPKRETDKIRLLAVERIVARGKKVTSAQILRELEVRYDILADRKTIYADLQAIDRFMPLEVTSGPRGGFKMIDWKEYLK
jgi:predicted DNA-binding transcriptional regulator YafY